MKKRSVFIFILIAAVMLLPFADTASATVGNTKNSVSAECTAASGATARLLKKPTGAMRLVSYNLLADLPGFGGTDATERAPYAEAFLRDFDADILCLQEVSPAWFMSLQHCPGITLTAVQPIRTVLFMKMNVIMFNESTVRLIKSGTVQFTAGNDTRTRFAVWAVFEQKPNGRKYAVINCHFNLIKNDGDGGNLLSAANQTNELCLLANDISKQYNCTVIAAGDFNCRERKTKTDSTYIYARLTSYFTDARKIAETVFSGAQKSIDSTNGDHIFMSGGAGVYGYYILAFPHSELISDHFAVAADFLQ